MAIVYKHSTPDGIIFYIGIGLSKKRAYSIHSRSSFWNKVYNKHGFVVEILQEGISWEEACLKESELIEKYGRRDLGSGILVNLTNGGDGSPGTIVNEKTKQLISKALTGKIVSEETKEKIRQARLGTKRSKETCEKLRQSGLKLFANGYIHPSAKKIMNVETGEIFENTSKLAKFLGISQGYVSRILSNKIKKESTKIKYKNYKYIENEK